MVDDVMRFLRRCSPNNTFLEALTVVRLFYTRKRASSKSPRFVRQNAVVLPNKITSPPRCCIHGSGSSPNSSGAWRTKRNWVKVEEVWFPRRVPKAAARSAFKGGSWWIVVKLMGEVFDGIAARPRAASVEIGRLERSSSGTKTARCCGGRRLSGSYEREDASTENCL